MRNTPRRGGRSSTPASARQSVQNVSSEPPQAEPRRSESVRRDRPSTAVSFGPALPAPSPLADRLFPMVGIDRYEKQKQVVVEDLVYPHVSPPVTTEFVR